MWAPVCCYDLYVLLTSETNSECSRNSERSLLKNGPVPFRCHQETVSHAAVDWRGTAAFTQSVLKFAGIHCVAHVTSQPIITNTYMWYIQYRYICTHLSYLVPLVSLRQKSTESWQTEGVGGWRGSLGTSGLWIQHNDGAIPQCLLSLRTAKTNQTECITAFFQKAECHILLKHTICNYIRVFPLGGCVTGCSVDWKSLQIMCN